MLIRVIVELVIGYGFFSGRWVPGPWSWLAFVVLLILEAGRAIISLFLFVCVRKGSDLRSKVVPSGSHSIHRNKYSACCVLGVVHTMSYQSPMAFTPYRYIIHAPDGLVRICTQSNDNFGGLVAGCRL